ncbi:MAG: TlpA family protein disulfide reductase, partial [Rhizobiales bacterium]|nr:TlpA family protein disulfide reductase [Hyphomicrobiales bacterium]
MSSETNDLATELDVLTWLNTPEPITLVGLRGRVVIVEAFQMLCPGCAQQALPQLTRIQETFSTDDVMVLGLHTVFEHHA